MSIIGIYQIQSRIKSERIYIGSSINVTRRWNEHLRELVLNKHRNNKLQRHYNKYGRNDLQFSVLVGCDKINLIANEQFFIDSYDPYFNEVKIAGNSEKPKGQVPWNKGKKTGVVPWNKGMKGVYKFKMPEEAKRKIAKASIGNKRALGFKHTEETKQRMKEGIKKRLPVSDATKEKNRIASLGNKNMLGKPRSEETKMRVSEGLKKYYAQKKLNKFDLIINS